MPRASSQRWAAMCTTSSRATACTSAARSTAARPARTPSARCARVDQVHHLPSHVSFTEGAGVGVPYVTAWRALFDKGRALPGETVLIHGASGAVGVAATQMASAAGLRVFGTAGTERGRQLAREQGAQRGVRSFSGRLRERRPGEDRRARRRLDHRDARERESRERSRPDRQARPHRHRRQSRRARAEPARDYGERRDGRRLHELERDCRPSSPSAHAAIVAGMERSGYKPQVGKEMPLADAPRAHEDVLKPGAYGKIVLVP